MHICTQSRAATLSETLCVTAVTCCWSFTAASVPQATPLCGSTVVLREYRCYWTKSIKFSQQKKNPTVPLFEQSLPQLKVWWHLLFYLQPQKMYTSHCIKLKILAVMLVSTNLCLTLTDFQVHDRRVSLFLDGLEEDGTPFDTQPLTTRLSISEDGAMWVGLGSKGKYAWFLYLWLVTSCIEVLESLLFKSTLGAFMHYLFIFYRAAEDMTGKRGREGMTSRKHSNARIELVARCQRHSFFCLWSACPTMRNTGGQFICSLASPHISSRRARS